MQTSMPTDRGPKIDLDEAKRLYLDDGLTLREIGERFGVSHQAVQNRLARAGITRATRGPRKKLDRDILRQLYVVEGLTLKAIGERLGAAVSLVARELKCHAIPRLHYNERESNRIERHLLETLYITEGLTQIETAAKLGVRVKIVQNELTRHKITFRHKRRPGPKQVRFGYDLLNQLYNVERLTCTQVGERLGVHEHIVRDELKLHGIKARRGGNRRPIQIDRDLLYKLYIVDGLKHGGVGAALGVGRSTVWLNLKRYGIYKRNFR